jgi:hypothetical protein
LRSLCNPAGEVQLKVVNDGVTIEPDDLPRLFDRFYRGDPRAATPIATTGSGCPSWRPSRACTEGDPGDVVGREFVDRHELAGRIVRRDRLVGVGRLLRSNDRLSGALNAAARSGIQVPMLGRQIGLAGVEGSAMLCSARLLSVAVLACMAQASPAQRQLVEVTLPNDRPLVRQLTAPPGEFIELCTRLQPGECSTGPSNRKHPSRSTPTFTREVR